MKFRIMFLKTLFFDKRYSKMGKLHDACENGDLKRVKKLIKQNPNRIHKKDKYKRTPLIIVCVFNNPNSITKEFNLKIAKELIKNGANVNEKCLGDKETPLFIAALNGNLEIVKELIKNGAHINEKDYRGITPLHMACKGGHIKIIFELIKNGANINEKDNYGDTPLHDAACNRHIKTVKKLINLGADTSIKNNKGELFSDFLDVDIEKLLEECSPLDSKEPCTD